MGITMFGFANLFAPLQALMAWFAPSPCGCAGPVIRTSIGGARPSRSPRAERAQAHAAAPAHRAPALRVVRVVERTQPAAAGRMFMSGRMADVCAELDRLAALEAAAS
jgi:hypothetical protein